MRKQKEFNIAEAFAEIERANKEIRDLNNPEILAKKVEEVFGNWNPKIDWTEVLDKALKEVNM